MIPQVSRIVATRVAARRAASQALQKRSMGGSAPAPEWTGIDKVVRGYFPEDYQLAGAILSGYAVLITAAALKPSSKAPEAAAAPAAAAPAASAGTIPGVDSDEFASFIESEENIMKLVDSLDK